MTLEIEKKFTTEEAIKIGDELGVDWTKIGQEQFRRGMDVELEHGKIDEKTNVTNNDPVITGKIALAHLNEFSDYYERLEKMEKEAEDYWENHKGVEWKEVDISGKVHGDNLD